MEWKLDKLGKRYGKEWIFRNISLTVASGGRLAVTGPNGSGKSTLLQVMAGAVAATEGSIDTQLAGTEVFSRIAIAAPYLELIEEMTGNEMTSFHAKFKPLLGGYGPDKVLGEVGLESARDKPIRFYSSGMKQRLKLGLAFFSDVPALFLDEPCANLDKEGIAVYQRLIAEKTSGRTLIVCSNDKTEYGFCESTIDILSFKVPTR